MKKQRELLTTVFVLLMLTLVIAAIPTEAEAAIYGDTVRLHIRARSDSEEDQAVKLEIRDRLLSKYSSALAVRDKEGARAELCARLEEIEKDINGWLCEIGCAYGCTVRLEEEWFDTREYGNFTLPAGIYDALIIELGGGAGANWWCVMYPPMCLDIATEDTGSYSVAENELIAGGKYRIKFKLLELCAELMR